MQGGARAVKRTPILRHFCDIVSAASFGYADRQVTGKKTRRIVEQGVGCDRQWTSKRGCIDQFTDRKNISRNFGAGRRCPGCCAG